MSELKNTAIMAIKIFTYLHYEYHTKKKLNASLKVYQHTSICKSNSKLTFGV